MLTISMLQIIITLAFEIGSGVLLSLVERLVWDQEVAGSNPVTPIQMSKFNNPSLICGCSSMVEH